MGLMVYADDVRSLPPSKDPTASMGVIGLHPTHWGSHTTGGGWTLSSHPNESGIGFHQCTAGGWWTLSSHPNPCVAGIRFDERHPEQSPEFSGHPHTNGGWASKSGDTQIARGKPKLDTECPVTAEHLSKVGCISKTAHKPHMPPAMATAHRQ